MSVASSQPGPSWRTRARAPLTVVDQGLVALTNLAITVTVARASGLTSFGEFSLVLAIMSTFLVLQRVLVLEPWLSHSDPSARADPFVRVLVLSLAALACGATSVIAIVITSFGPRTCLVLGLASAGMLAQDATRLAALRLHSVRHALTSDLVLFLGTLGGCAVTLVIDTGSFVALSAWTAGLCLAALSKPALPLGPPRFRGLYAWWRQELRPLAAPLLADMSGFLAASQWSLFLLALYGGSPEVGLARAVSTLFSPLGLVITGLTYWLLPNLAQREPAARKVLERHATLVLTAGSVAALVALTVVGPALCALFFDLPAEPAAWVILLCGSSVACNAIGSPWLSGAKVRRRLGPVAATRFATAVLMLALMVTLDIGSAGTFFAVLLGHNLCVLAATFLNRTR